MYECTYTYYVCIYIVVYNMLEHCVKCSKGHPSKSGCVKIRVVWDVFTCLYYVT